MQEQKLSSFACEACRAAKRRCDAAKPQCSLCARKDQPCVYNTTRVRKRKYWDEDYVRALEDQVQSLLAVQKSEGASSSDRPALPGQVSSGDVPTTKLSPEADVLSRVPSHAESEKQKQQSAQQDRSQQAMEELSVMLWRTNIGDGMTIVNDSSTGSQYTVEAAETRRTTSGVKVPDNVLQYCQDHALVHELAQLFLDHINREHQFTYYKTTDFLVGYPYQNLDLTFLHSAIIAVGATFSHRPDALTIGDAFTEFAESLTFPCARQSPSLCVLQGLCMMSWRSLAIGRDHFGWIFISMAAGICVQLRLHVLALNEFDDRALEPTPEEIRTFWMFYIIDRTAISILGRNCALPWRRVNVPNFDTTFTSETADLEQISFAWQCKLWYLHDQNMDQIFASTFDTLPASQQVRLFVQSHEALQSFFRSRDKRLDLSGDSTPKCVLLFHMAYQMAMLVAIPPFLRLFASRKTDEVDQNMILLILRSVTHSASTMARLVRIYRKALTFDHANPVMIHHLLSAAIVHLMNATTSSIPLRRQSVALLRLCMDLLSQMKHAWPARTNKSIKVIQVLAQRWGVTSALPLEFSNRVRPSFSSPESDTQATLHRPGNSQGYAPTVSDASMPNSYEATSYMPPPMQPPMQAPVDMSGGGGVPHFPSEAMVDFDAVNLSSFSQLSSLNMPNFPSNIPPTTSTSTAPMSNFQPFDTLNTYDHDNFDWLFGNPG